MVLQRGLKLSTGCSGSRVSQQVLTKVTTACVLPVATRHELQSNPQMAATCAGL